MPDFALEYTDAPAAVTYLRATGLQHIPIRSWTVVDEYDGGGHATGQRCWSHQMMTAIILVPMAPAAARTALNSAAWVSLRNVRLVVWVMTFPCLICHKGCCGFIQAGLAGECLS